MDSKKVNSASAESMDCHAATNAAARNDDKNAKSVEKSHDKKAERVFDSHAAGGRIFDEKAGLCSLLCGDKPVMAIAQTKGKLPAFSQKANAQNAKAQLPQTLRVVFLSVLYSGRSPKAPGTAGSALSVLLGLPILLYSAQTLFLLACLLGIIAVREIDKWEAYSKKHDEKWIVIDELVGVWLTMAIIGAVAGCSVSLMIVAFVTFRLFDIWKPSIIGRIDRKLKGGLGVVLDDVVAGLVAGVFSIIVLRILAYFGIDLSLW
ncbi:hypothetical protein HMPREF2087_00663 [Helicobacter canis NCTC 12740]|uniref:YutG/PgpA domain-containing protein n=1 Tax=Helicobacter canis NCTC 12740 TaxID=1357399 RepID=V8CKW3_9HELI|nr:hypothetical protein HMPREF2087_00663 [Helicobacter canis NCTC 12740]